MSVASQDYRYIVHDKLIKYEEMFDCATLHAIPEYEFTFEEFLDIRQFEPQFKKSKLEIIRTEAMKICEDYGWSSELERVSDVVSKLIAKV